jgi:hypothetical protein
MLAYSRMAAPNFNNGVSGFFHLNYPSFPALTSSTSDIEHMSLAHETEHANEGTGMPPQPTVVEKLVSALLSAFPYHEHRERALLGHLHHTAATLTDVEALIPALNNDALVMSKLAENIGYFHNLSSTPTNPSPELEQILGHILTQVDEDHQTYEMTKMQLKHYNDQLCQVDPQQRLRVHNEDKARQQNLKTLKWEANQRKKSMPAHMKEKFMPGQLPGGCLTPSDVITKCYGMSYAEYMRISQSARCKLEMKATLPDLSSPDLPKGEDFSRTRLHNGPGLTDRKRPKVRLPQIDDRRTEVLVLTASMDKSVESEYMWARTKVECPV